MKFEITDQDLEDEMGTGQNRRPRQSKNQALYGVWAESSDEEDRPTMGLGSKGKQRDYTTPINFVSGGVKKKDDEEENDKEDNGMKSDGESSGDAICLFIGARGEEVEFSVLNSLSP